MSQGTRWTSWSGCTTLGGVRCPATSPFGSGGERRLIHQHVERPLEAVSVRAQGAEDSGDDCILVDVRAVVIASFERDELRVWDLFGWAPSLVEEVGVSGAEEDEASDLPRKARPPVVGSVVGESTGTQMPPAESGRNAITAEVIAASSEGTPRRRSRCRCRGRGVRRRGHDDQRNRFGSRRTQRRECGAAQQFSATRGRAAAHSPSRSPAPLLTGIER